MTDHLPTPAEIDAEALPDWRVSDPVDPDELDDEYVTDPVEGDES